jgi:Domain of unknown function (DUF4365)/Anaphase-promoting complex, cyclosome, subunit 3
MAKRPRQHILETESENAFNTTLPSEWVINYQKTDYGIDAKVQIFENGESTPFFFFAQLKSTEEVKSNKTISCPFSNERLNEYREYPLPVLLVLFDFKSKRLFCKWIYEFFAELPIIKQNKLGNDGKTNVKFKQKISKDFIQCLFEEVKEYYFLSGKVSEDFEEIRVTLELNLEEKTSLEIEKEFRNWLRENKSFNFIKLGKFINPTFLITKVIEVPAITSVSKKNKVAYPFFESQSDENFREHLLSSLKVVLADSLALSGRRNLALDIITEFFLDNTKTSSTSQFLFAQPYWAIEYAVKNRNLEAFEVANEIVGSENDSYAHILAFSSQFITLSTKLTQKKYKYFLEEAIRKAKKDKDKGIQNYNLANNFRSTDSFRKAIIHYCKAAKLAPKYLDKSYWWAEIAGCFFLLNKFRWAEHCYRKSIELGEQIVPSKYLLGDCLLYQGKFEEASKELEVYLNNEKNPCANAILKKWLADFLLKTFGNTRRNQTKSNELVENAIKLGNLEEAGKMYFESLKHDPLSDLAWYNYRVSKGSSISQLNFHLWLASILTNPNDSISWAYFIVLILFEFPKIPKINEELEFIKLAVISEAWKDKDRVEDSIRSIVPTKLTPHVFEILDLLGEQAEVTFFNEPPILLRKF